MKAIQTAFLSPLPYWRWPCRPWPKWWSWSTRRPPSSMSKDQVAQFFLGKSSSMTPVDQPESAPIRAEFYKKVTDKDASQVKSLWSKLVFTGKATMPKEAADSAAVKKAVAADPKGHRLHREERGRRLGQGDLHRTVRRTHPCPPRFFRVRAIFHFRRLQHEHQAQDLGTTGHLDHHFRPGRGRQREHRDGALNSIHMTESVDFPALGASKALAPRSKASPTACATPSAKATRPASPRSASRPARSAHAWPRSARSRAWMPPASA
jgi:hypothetical protein